VHDTGAAGVGQKLIAVSDQGAGGHRKFDSHPSLTVIDQIGHLTFAKGKLFRHHTQKAFFAIDQQAFQGFALFTIFITKNYPGPSNAKLISFPAHGLNQDGQLKLPPALDQDAVPLFGFLHFNGHIDQGLF